MKIKSVSILMFCLVISCAVAGAEEFIQVPAVIHVHTTFSSGHYSIEELVAMASAKGIEVLVVTDHDLVVMEYGLPPFRNIVKKRETNPSILSHSPEKFLAEIERVNKIQKSVLVIPGTQSSPFYYWTGMPFTENFTANDYRKELLLIGMKKPEDYENLPILHRGFSTKYFWALLPRSIFILIAFILSIYLFFQKGILKLTGGAVGVFSLILLINSHPFQSSMFDSYHGNQGIKPFQELIDYVAQQGGLTYWAHPESNYSRNGVELGPVVLKTAHYPDDLVTSINYTGFSAIYGDTVTVTDPGKHWDQVLNEYCVGNRLKPAWGISGADYHGRSKHEDPMDTYQTVLFVKSKTTEAVIQALSRGRAYAIRKAKGPRLVLDGFRVINSQTGTEATLGGELPIKGYPTIQIRLSSFDGGENSVKGILVRGGEIIEKFEGKTPLETSYDDHSDWAGKSYYRLEITSPQMGKVLSNPIFVTRI
jgi:hypothetical protein